MRKPDFGNIEKCFSLSSAGLPALGKEYEESGKYGFAACCFVKAAEKEKNGKLKSDYLLKASDIWLRMNEKGMYPVISSELASFALDFNPQDERGVFLKAQAEYFSGHPDNAFHLFFRIWLNTSYRKMKIQVLPYLIRLSGMTRKKFSDDDLNEIGELCKDNFDEFNPESMNEIMEFYIPERSGNDFFNFRKPIDIAFNHFKTLESYFSPVKGDAGKGLNLIKPEFMKCADIILFPCGMNLEDMKKEDLSFNEYKLVITFHSKDSLYYLKSLDFGFLFERCGFDYFGNNEINN